MASFLQDFRSDDSASAINRFSWRISSGDSDRLEIRWATNGTTLNGEDVETATIVISGDEIHCGKVGLQVRLTLDELSPNTLQINR